jgi:hypothetical protein
MKKLIGIFILGMLLPGILHAQVVIKEYDMPQYLDVETQSGNIQLFILTPESPYIGLKGDPFLVESFQKGFLIIDGNIKIKDVLLRYNIYHQRMEMLKDTTVYVISSPDRIELLDISGKEFVYSPFKDEKVITRGYFEVLSSGTYMLLKRYICRLEEGYYNVQLSAGDRSYKYVKFDNYFSAKSDTPAAKLKTSTKGISIALESKNGNIERYIKENKLNMKHEEDLIKVFSYKNSNLN